MRTLKLWAGGDAHVGTDLARAHRRSINPTHGVDRVPCT